MDFLDDDFTPFEGGSESDSDAVLVRTGNPVPIRLDRHDHDLTPSDYACLGTFVGDRLIARRIVPDEAVDKILSLDLFDDPVNLALAAREEDPGLKCHLFAMVPLPVDEVGMAGEQADQEEPWKASVPSSNYEQAVAGEDEDEESGPSVGLLFLGEVVRFEDDRKHPADLPREAADVLRTVLTGKLSSATEKAIDRLLEEI